MKKILIISMLLISSPLFSGHHVKGEMSNAEVVKKAYATFGSGDIEGWKKLHTSDLKFTIFGDLPQSGIHYGADAVRLFILSKFSFFKALKYFITSELTDLFTSIPKSQ